MWQVGQHGETYSLVGRVGEISGKYPGRRIYRRAGVVDDVTAHGHPHHLERRLDSERRALRQHRQCVEAWLG